MENDFYFGSPVDILANVKMTDRGLALLSSGWCLDSKKTRCCFDYSTM